MRVLLVVYDNGAFLHHFPQGTAYIASALREAGHSVEIWNQDVHHYPDEALTAHLDAGAYDVIGIGVIAGYYQYKRLLGLSKAIAAARHKPFFMLGGHGPTPEPAHFMAITGADAVVMGEGEITVVDLLSAVQEGRDLATVEGIAWRDGDEFRVNKPRPLVQDLSSLPWPAYDLFPVEYYRMMRLPGCDPTEFSLPVLSGRGCTFRCTFCYRMDTGFRPREAQDVLDEVSFLQKTYGIGYIDFSDELLMSSKQRTIDFCEAIIERGMTFKWFCNGRLNYATPEVLEVMKRAGCVFINYGIESVDDTVLKNMRKALRYDQIIAGVEATLKVGISPGLNIIFGNKGDNRETLRKAVDFLKTYDNQAQVRTIRPVTPYPGSPLYDEAIRDGLVKDCADFYENKHLNSDLLAVNFTELTDEEFYEALHEANLELLTHHTRVTNENYRRQLDDLYLKQNASFRGFRQT